MAGTLVLMHVMAPRIRRNRRATRRATSAVTGFIGELFGAAQAVKLNTATEGVLRRFAALGETRRRAALRDSLVVEGTDAAIWNFVHIGTGFILLLSARAMRAGSFSVGDFALFTMYIGWLTNLPRWAGRLMARSKQSVVGMGRMARILDGEPADALVVGEPTYLRGPEPEVPAMVRTPADRLDVLEVRGLTYLHPDGGRGIRDASLVVERGRFVVVTGRVGSGKTTLLRALLGLVGPAAGDIRWNGTRVDDPKTFFVPPRSAYTPQVPRLFSETLHDNILLGVKSGELDAEEAIRLAVFEDDLVQMPDGLETIIGPRGVRLSGGQVQRAAAARMFVRGAELCVFDDLSSALDLDTEARLWERVFARGDATCLVVSHRRAALRRADSVIVMRDGRIADAGRLDELLERCDEMRRIWSAGDAQPLPA
jgi:ATP-binding cassette subfamily B protein